MNASFDINHLRATYPYLAKELQHVADSLKEEEKKKDIQRKKEEFSDLKDYQGPDYNRIDPNQDNILIMRAKLEAQKNWIEAQV